MRINHFYLCLGLLLTPQAVLAQESCLAPVNSFQANQQLTSQQIQVKANRAEIRQDTIAIFQGKVDILSNSAQIQAEQARIDKNTQQLTAEGNIRYRDNQIMVNSDQVMLNTSSGELTMDNTEYRLTLYSGRGAAEKIQLSGDEGISLQDASFTTCPEGSQDWQIKAQSIELKPGQIWGEAKHTRFYVGGVPVFYLPYFSFPVTDLRQTGLLVPKISSSDSTGLSYEQPLYWNIAPNYDATVSPRLMSSRGVQLKTEFRYLSDNQQGQVNLEYLPNDRDTSTNEDRYFYRYIHEGQLSSNWQLNAEVNGLSDDNYIVDLGSDYYSRADTHLYQTLALTYYSAQLDFSMQVRDFEVIGDHPASYRALPEMKLKYQSLPFSGLEFRFNSELAYFDNSSLTDPKAVRLHLAPTLAFPYQTQWGEFLAETSLLHTQYKQDNIAGSNLDKDVDRTLGQARLYGSLNFERPSSWYGKKGIQTLEPKIQYLYTTFEDQTGIGLYDTTKLLNDFAGLFRGQEFTGLDRISDNNQLTLGLTSRILDKNNREQFKVSVGQIFYLADNKVLLASKEENRSALASEIDWQLSSKWFAHSEVQVSTSTDKVERSNLSLEYQRSNGKIIQINHRYIRDLSGEKIDQVGLTASWPLAQNWHWVGRWYRDMNLNRTIETYAGLQYESCCWSIRFVAQRHLSNRFDVSGIQSTNEFDSSIGINFSFKGLGSGNTSRDMLKDGLFGYRQPYLLN
jgi:LPS-assembly protein